MIFFRFIASWPEIEGCLYLVSISEMKVKDMARKERAWCNFCQVNEQSQEHQEGLKICR